MRRVREVIVVEGRYDKNTVSQAVSGTIIETNGFGIFSDKDKVSLLCTLARKQGLIILTDSDSAGFLIRGHLKGMINGGVIKHAYIPDIHGREKRKSAPSKEGKLGVEGMSREVIISALERAGATFEDEASNNDAVNRISKADFYDAGLTGSHGSREKRAALIKKLGLPERLTANGLLEVLNVLYTRDEFLKLIG